MGGCTEGGGVGGCTEGGPIWGRAAQCLLPVSRAWLSAHAGAKSRCSQINAEGLAGLRLAQGRMGGSILPLVGL